MRLHLLILSVVLLGCTQQPQSQPSPSSAVQQSKAPVQVRSRGTVVSISSEFSAVTISHEAIPEYGMGAMTMEFGVDEASKLDGIKVGDEVSFELKGPLDIETITVARGR